MHEESGVEDLSAADPVIDAVLRASRALVAVAARSLAQATVEVTLPQYRPLCSWQPGEPRPWWIWLALCPRQSLHGYPDV